MCCRNCAQRLQTIDKSLQKFKETYDIVRNRLTVSHGHKTTKRMSKEHQDSSKRKALFQPVEQEEGIETDQADSSFDIPPQTHHSIYDDLLGVMSTGSPSQIVGKIMSTQDIAEGVTEYVLNTLKQEVKGLCSKAINSILRNNSKKHLLSFSFKKVAEEWIEKAPLFHKFIICSSTNPSAQVRNKLKKGDSLLHAQVAAGCKLLNIYSREMKCLQQINNIIMLKGGMKKSGFTRMQSTNDCQSYDATIDLADTLANQWDEDILKWQNTVKSETEIESQLIQQISYIGDTIELCGGHANEGNEGLTLEKEMLMKELRDLRTSMHPGYYFVGDNVDMVTKVRHMTVSNQHKDQHMFQMCAYLHRVSGNELDNTTPLQDAKTALFSQLVPSAEEKELMLQHFTYLVAKQWCTYLDHFAPYEAVIPPYIDHPHLKETKTRTARVNMGVLRKNESKNEDMADICKFLHKYIPGHDDQSNTPPVKILSGGDYLTFERHKQAQMSVRDDATPSLRLEGLVPRMEEFHNQAELLKVIWQRLYSTVSSRDIGTLFAARNIVNARNVSNDPSGNYYANIQMCHVTHSME